MTRERKRLILSAFRMNTNSHITHGMWRHPDSTSHEFNDLDHWIHLAKVLERGKFDTLFLADIVGVYAPYRGSTDIFVEEGLQIPSNDPSMLLSALISSTEHLGLTFTSSILQEHPFNFARRVSTLDQLSKGRVGWNIVTNALDSAAQNFGHDAMEDHDERYRWADEYVEVAYKLWESSWDEDAVTRDKQGLYADPRKVHPIHHVGDRYRVRGPHSVEPSPQRTPFLFQAGASNAGRDFAAKHAEAVFIPTQTPEQHRSVIGDIQARARNAGRLDGDIAFLPMFSFVVGSTEEEAQRKSREYDEYLSIDGFLAHMGGHMGIDLSEADHAQPLAEFAKEVRGVQSMTDVFLASAPEGSEPTVGDFIRSMATRDRTVGTPEQIADVLETWVDAGVTGLNVGSIIVPGSLEEFVDHVVPTLQERGLVQKEYREGTLREKVFGDGAYLPERHRAGQLRQERAALVS